MWESIVSRLAGTLEKWKLERTGESIGSSIRQAKNREIAEAATAAEKFSEPLQKRVLPLLEEALEANIKDIALTAKRKETTEDRQQRALQERAISAEKFRTEQAAWQQRLQDMHTREVDHFREETQAMAIGMMTRCWALAVQHAKALNLSEFKFEWDSFLCAKRAWQLSSLKEGERKQHEAIVTRLTELFDSGFEHLCRNLAPAAAQSSVLATLGAPTK